MVVAEDDVTTLRVSKSKTKPMLDDERQMVQGGRRAETDDELLQRLIKELREYRRRCG